MYYKQMVGVSRLNVQDPPTSFILRPNSIVGRNQLHLR